LFGAAHLVFLVDENACGQENEFDSHNQGQERKRIWIERLKPSDPSGVQDNPGENEEDLCNNEAKASEEAGNATTPSLRPGLLRDQLLLKLCYRLDVPLGRRGDRGVRGHGDPFHFGLQLMLSEMAASVSLCVFIAHPMVGGRHSYS
jgi:hypothetical protein